MVTLSIDSFRMRKGCGLVEGDRAKDEERGFSNQVTVFHGGLNPDGTHSRNFLFFGVHLNLLHLTGSIITKVGQIINK